MARSIVEERKKQQQPTQNEKVNPENQPCQMILGIFFLIAFFRIVLCRFICFVVNAICARDPRWLWISCVLNGKIDINQLCYMHRNTEVVEEEEVEKWTLQGSTLKINDWMKKIYM